MDKSLDLFQSKIQRLIQKKKLNKALTLIYKKALHITFSSNGYGKAFGSETFDSLLQVIGHKNLQNLQFPTPEIATEEHIIYIVSKVHRSGGHTRVLQNIINALPNAKHTILLTEIDGKSHKDYFLNTINKQINVKIVTSKDKKLIHKLSWLQNKLYKIRASKIYLFTNPEDVVGIAAVSGLANVNFYHHADHTFSLGLYLKDTTHIDIHQAGLKNCRQQGISNVYLPLSIRDQGFKQKLAFKIDNQLITCTVAGKNKIEKPYFISYCEIVPEILSVTQGKHIHIGKLSNRVLIKIKKLLKKKNIPLNRFQYIPWVPSVWKVLQKLQVDLYISPFPYGAGLTLIEAMGAGVPVALHRNLNSEVLSCTALAYPDVFIWEQPHELIDYCKNVTAEILERHSLLGRKHYEQNYSELIFNDLLKKESFLPIEDSKPNYQINYKEKNLTFSVKLDLMKLYKLKFYIQLKNFRRNLTFS